VTFIRQPANVGKVRNYETGLQACRGEFVHQLHGDDLVLPGFYREMEAAFQCFPGAGAFFCESDYIDETGRITGRTGQERNETGILENWLARIAEAQLIQTPSIVVRRDVYEKLGAFDRRLDGNEDWEMWIRVSNSYPVGFCATARAQYRTSVANTSSLVILRGKMGGAQRALFNIVDEYLPRGLVTSVQKPRAFQQALYFCDQIPKVMEHGNLPAWFRLCGEILGFSRRPFVLRRIASLTVRHLWKRQKRAQAR
jgi:hypothetical protein